MLLRAVIGSSVQLHAYSYRYLLIYTATWQMELCCRALGSLWWKVQRPTLLLNFKQGARLMLRTASLTPVWTQMWVNFWAGTVARGGVRALCRGGHRGRTCSWHVG